MCQFVDFTEHNRKLCQSYGPQIRLCIRISKFRHTKPTGGLSAVFARLWSWLDSNPRPLSSGAYPDTQKHPCQPQLLLYHVLLDKGSDFTVQFSGMGIPVTQSLRMNMSPPHPPVHSYAAAGVCSVFMPAYNLCTMFLYSLCIAWLADRDGWLPALLALALDRLYQLAG